MLPFSMRRQRLADSMRQRGGGLALLMASPEAIRNRDAHYPYRQDSYLHYLTGFPEPEAILAIVATDTQTRSILFCRDKDPERELWDGWRYGPQGACDHFGLDDAHPLSALDAELTRMMADVPALFYPLAHGGPLESLIQRCLNTVRGQVRTGIQAPATLHDVHALLDELRLIKDDHEIAIMRRAAQIAAQGHKRAMRATRPGRYEYEIEAELRYECHRLGAPEAAYGPIVATGGNACVLHYRANNAVLREGELLLIDAGCEYQNYASDITRTFPVNGRFSGPQRTLYELVLAAQTAAIAATRPGATFDEPHEAAVRVLAQGLIDCGLLSGSLDSVLERGAYRRFYMHRTGHWLGLDVHDCGAYRNPGPDHGWRTLAPGMVLTIEPGLYVRADDDIPSAYHNLGIRIEDDALVTAQGCDILSSDVPKTVGDIEALMQDA
jgi:Xaa-Pro aminopeptidase